MNEPLDLASIIDTNYLKALAYDRIAAIDQMRNELQAINTRIAQLADNPPLDPGDGE